MLNCAVNLSELQNWRQSKCKYYSCTFKNFIIKKTRDITLFSLFYYYFIFQHDFMDILKRAI